MKKMLISFLVALLFFTSCQNTPGSANESGNESFNTGKKSKTRSSGSYHKKADDASVSNDNEDVIDRHPGHLIYTKHARCRMGCRHIDESEVTEILEKGRINYGKSEPNGHPDPKYALEGTTHDGQQVRIIFAPAKRGMVVITVIDLEGEWSCDCR